MPVHNEEIARAFDELADLLEVQGANPFRVRAYRTAALSVRSLGRVLADMVTRGEALERLPGIGKALAGKITEMVRTGHVRALDELHKQLPASLEDLLKIPGLGPKRVQVLHRELGVRDTEGLRRAAETGAIRGLAGFGEKTERRILEALAVGQTQERRFLLSTAADYAEPLARWLGETAGVDRLMVAGSYRRGRETVGDLDILVTAKDPQAVLGRFAGYEEIAELVAQGKTRSTAFLRSGLQVDLRVVRPESFGAALHYFTGSKAHNIQIRRLGQQAGLKINEYGVFKGRRRVAGATEGSVLAALGLPVIPPELREGSGEIEAAREGRLPELVRLEDLKGDLHLHTSASDGGAGIEAMALAARAAGLRYIAITDHSRGLAVAHGLDAERLARQGEEIERIRERVRGIEILKGIEVDIREDGRLDLPDRVLARLDLVVGAMHSHFGLSGRRQTARMLRALDHPYFSILAHPSGRLLDGRAPSDLDMERVIRAARERGCFLELNAQPRRLDLDARYCRMAREAGVRVSIDSDSHSERGFGNLHWGIAQARRGWLEPKDVLNTLDLRELRALLGRTMGR